MANTLTTLQPTLFSQAREVAAEPFGMVDAIGMAFDDKRVAKGDVVDVPVAPARSATDFSASNITSTGDDATATTIQVEITKSRKVSWNLTSEQQLSLENGSINEDWAGQLFAQGMRELRNEAEIDACVAAKEGASRAYGTAGTTPFASDLSALTNARKILLDNGAPMSDLQCVFDTSAGLNLRNLSVIQEADKAGSPEERRSGQFGRQMGFALHESAGIALHTKGTGTSYQLSAAGAIGDTSISVDTGSGTLLAGDVVTIAGTTDKYVANSALSGGSFTIGDPGLLAAEADNDAVTIGNNYTPNIAFSRGAIAGIMRPPAMPQNANIQQMLISDQMGMTYLALQIAQYGQISWELHLAWGFKATNSGFISTILG